jgi:Fe-S-cluster containining protein
MSHEVFYSSGLRFECTRCSKCCRHTPGYVFLSAADLENLVAAAGLERQEFLRTFCRTVSFGVAKRVSLREKANLDCIFWENGGCSVYEARPLQCRSFPFWSACVSSPEEWDFHARQCAGMGKGPLHSRREIESMLSRRVKEGFLEA